MQERIQKILSAAGFGSRRFCETLIVEGRVTVNGKKITELGSKADIEKDNIKVDGKTVKAAAKTFYLALNKPAGYTSTRSDPHARHTVMELLQDIPASLYPAGRLDVDTTGLLIMTNDGNFANVITHPSYQVEKEYLVTAQGRVSVNDLSLLANGIQLDDGPTAPAVVSLLGYTENRGRSRVSITIREGRKRQIKRMFAAINHKVLQLCRVRIGAVRLGNLPEGKWRNLSAGEVAALTGKTKPK